MKKLARLCHACKWLPFLWVALPATLFALPTIAAKSNWVVRMWIDGKPVNPSGDTSGDIRFVHNQPPTQLPENFALANFAVSAGSGNSGGGEGPGGGGGGASNSQKAPAPPKDNSDKCNATGNPVKLSTGEKLKEEFDYPAFSTYGIPLTRTYRSVHATGSLFGSHWTSNVDYPRLIYTFVNCVRQANRRCLPRTVTHVRPDGTRHEYTLLPPWSEEGGSINAPTLAASPLAAPNATGEPGVPAASTQVVSLVGSNVYPYSASGALSSGMLYWNYGSGWVLQIDKQTVTYTNGGFIRSITDSAGAQTTFTLNWALQIAAVTSPTGQSLTFTWTGNRVTKASDHAGNEWAYAYDSASGMLTSVTSPGAPGDTRSYHYEAADKTLLTGLSVNGVRQTTYSYLADRRVQVSRTQDNEEVDSFAYGTDTRGRPTTTVTDARGQPTT